MSWLTNAWSKVFGMFKQADGFGASMIADIGANGRPPRRDEATTIATYNSAPMNRAILDRISGNVSANRWRLFRTGPSSLTRSAPRELKEFIHTKPAQDREKTIQRLVDTSELEEITEHPLLSLIRKPNPQMSGIEFRKVEQIWMDQVGESFTVIERASNGEPNALWPIVPHWVQDVPSSMDGNFVIQWRSGRRNVAFNDMIWMRNLNPSNPYGRGTGIAQTLNNELDSENYASINTSMRMFNNGTPEMLIIAEGMKKESVEVLMEDWNKQRFPGFLRSHQPHFTNAKNLRIEKLEPNMVDMDMINLREFLIRIQIQSFGIPPEVLGLIENSNKATINSAHFLYACNTLTPRLMLWENTLNEDLVPQFGRTDLLLLFDNPIPEDQEFALEVSKAHPEAFSIDDMRELADMGRLGTKLSKRHPVPTNIFLQSFEETAEEPVKPAEMEDDDDQDSDDGGSAHLDDEEKEFVIEIQEPIEITEKRGALDDDWVPTLLPFGAVLPREH